MHKKKKLSKAAFTSAIRCGAIDFGSKALKYRIVDYDAGGKPHIIYQESVECAFAHILRPTHYEADAIGAKAERTARAIAETFKGFGVLPENVHAVATAAFREVEKANTDYGNAALRRVREALHPYSFDIIDGHAEAQLIADTSFHCLFTEPYSEIADLTKRHDNICVIHFGGRSTELVAFRNKRIADCKVIDMGVQKYTWQAQDPDNPDHAQAEFQAELTQSFPENQHSLLAVSGGLWRAVAKMVCDKGSPALTREIALIRLAVLAQKKDESYFTSYTSTPSYKAVPIRMINSTLSFIGLPWSLKLKDHSVRKHAHHMAAAAQALIQVIHHTGAKDILFLKHKMINQLADMAYVSAKQRMERPAPNS